ncbi:MAG: hypothetical protein WCS37_20200, partial [Chloroflexota bacterium]
VQLAEGDIIITFNKTLDLMRQVMDMLLEHEPESPLIQTLREAKRLMRRGVVEQIYNIGFGVLKDVLEGEEDEAVVEGQVILPEATPAPLRSTEDEEEEEDEVKAPEDETLGGKRRHGRRRGKPSRYMGTPRR